MIKCIVVSIFFLLIGTIHSQQNKPNFMVRYLQKFTNDTTNKTEIQSLIYPTIAYSPETHWEFGASAVGVGFAKKDTNNRLSEFRAFSFITSLKQYGLMIEHAFYSHRNRWFLLGLMKTQSFPLYYHGIGYNSPKEKLAVVEAFTFNWRERMLRKISGNVYLGLELDFQSLSRVNFKSYTNDTMLLKPLGYKGYHNFGLGMGVLFDNRHNVLNVREGFFAEIAVLNYTKAFGASSNFSSIFTDIRYFYPVRKRNVIALQSISQFTLGDAPFNQQAMMGGEMMMRGYYFGRFRDRHYLSLQCEYRMLPLSFAKKFGLAFFASAGMVYNNPSSITIGYLKSAAGLGLHYLLFPKKDVWTRLDFAVNSELGSGLYIYMGCAF